jgi:hypothetical protein
VTRGGALSRPPAANLQAVIATDGQERPVELTNAPSPIPTFEQVKAIGHYRRGADTNHILGLCEECDAHYLARATLSQVEDWYRRGLIWPDQFEAYGHVWATSAPRFGDYSAWAAAPTSATVARHAELIRAALSDGADV